MAIQQVQPLNIAEEKLRCIENINGKYLVIAGAGTGKTFTISQRIKNILLNGTDKNGNRPTPERILCLSYTNVAAEEMLNAVKNITEDETININSTTFHGFGNSIINEYSDEFGFNTDSIRLITENICKIFIKEIIDDKTNNLPNLLNQDGKKYSCINTIYTGIKNIKNNGFFHTDKEKFEQALFNAKYYGGKITLYENKINALKHEIAEKEAQGRSTKKLNNILDTISSKKIPELENDIKKQLEIFDFYIELQKKMEKYGYMDFDDMILMIINKFENDKDFLKEISDKFDYILVDEYQDTNPIQNKIIEYLSSADGCKNIFAVGDDDQSIYSFQGAKASAMKDFIEKVGIEKDHIYCLTENRRSTQNILDISRIIADTQNDYKNYLTHRIGEKNNIKDKDIRFINEYNQVYTPLVATQEFKGFINKTLSAKNTNLTSKPVNLYTYDNELQEKLAIVNQINTLINNGINASEIAIIATTNDELDEYEDLLRTKGIPSELKEGKNIFKIKAVMVLLAYLQLLVNPDMYSDKFYSYLLSEPFNFSFADYKKIHSCKNKYKNLIKLLKEENIDYDVIHKFIDENKDNKICNDLITILTENNYKEDTKVKEFLKTYELLSKKKKDATSIKSLILDVVNKTGILDYYTEIDVDNKMENLLGIKKLLEFAEDYEGLYKDNSKDSTLYDFIEYITDLSKQDVKIFSDKPMFKKSAVQLTTYHSSKGKQYSYVFLPNMTDTKWESKSATGITKLNLDEYDTKLYSSFDDTADIDLAFEFLEEEKREQRFMERTRLLFVGITRAKHTLYISYSKENELSWFIKQVQEKYPRETDVFVETSVILEENEEFNLYKNLMISTDYDNVEEFIDFIDYKISNLEPYSPTSINTYLNCKRKFFYEYILGLKPGLSDETNTIYGTAMHYACQKAIEHITKDNGKTAIDIDTFYNIFAERLKKSALNKYDLDSKLKNGKDSIYGKKKENSDTMEKTSFYEFFNKIPTDKYYKAECNVKGKIALPDGTTVEIGGNIDRLDYDKEKNEYAIFDYKATEKSINNKITVGGEKEGYYNQIALYKYILINGDFYIDGEYHKDPLNVVSTKFYITDRNTDTDKLVDLKLTREDCEDVKNKFANAIYEIKQHKFNSLCDSDEDTCSFCHNNKFCHFDKLKYIKGVNNEQRTNNKNS